MIDEGKIKDFGALMDFTIRGIENHLQFDEVSKEAIAGALTLLHETYFRLFEEDENGEPVSREEI